MKRYLSPLSLLFATSAIAQTAAPTPALKIDGADTAFMIIATAFVLMMTLPALALFYSGMVRKKNVLGTMAQSVASIGLITILWFVAGYSLTFSGDGAIIGNLDRLFLSGVGAETISPLAKTIPENLFFMFQMSFAIITCALIGGGVADRMRFSAFLIFISLWLFVVYVPSAHWVWGGGFLSVMGVQDFAGGIVVHINAGIAGLVAALVLGPRLGFGRENMSPFDLTLALVGTGLLWVGWFGFNGGSALGANGRAVSAILSTHMAACMGALAWMALEWIERGKPSVLGLISGAIAGLGTVTPASGFILAWHGAVIGLLAGIVCYYACIHIKHRLKYDDSLDVFGVHGVGGILGTFMLGVFATGVISASDGVEGIKGWIDGNASLMLTQLKGIVIAVVYCALGTWVCLKVTSLFTPLRLSQDDERQGLDLSQHGESIHSQ